MADTNEDLLKAYCFDIVEKSYAVDNFYKDIFLSLIQHAKFVVNENKELDKTRAGKINILGFFKQERENYQRDLLHALLDPKGSHRHGIEYLRLFLETIGFEHLEKYDLNEVEVLKETHGRIDLLLKHPEFCVIIEMKIYAGDQDKQLERYYNKMLEERSDESIFLYYLTLDGHKPTKQSIGEIDINKVESISFKEHIYKWIDRLPVRINEPLLSSALVQYRHCLEYLTNQTEEEISMTKRLLEIILKDEKANSLTIGDLDVLANTIQELKKHKYTNVLVEVEKELKNQVSAIKGKICIDKDGGTYPKIYVNSADFDESVWACLECNLGKLDARGLYYIGILDLQHRKLDYFNDLDGYGFDSSGWWPAYRNVDIDINNFDALALANELIDLFNMTQEVLKNKNDDC